MPTLALAILLAAAAGGGVPFVDDDYEKARALAMERKVPLVVDVWAPW